MAPMTTYSSRRRTILVFVLEAGGPQGTSTAVLSPPDPRRSAEVNSASLHSDGRVSRYSVGRFDYDGLFKVVPTPNDGQWEGLKKLVAERNPKVIGINTSEAFNHADGLTANEKDNLMKALGPEFASRVKSAEKLAVDWLDIQLPEEADIYRHVMQVAHKIIREAFSNEVIAPGVTTIGYHGHGAGSPIGVTDYQQGAPVRGDFLLNAYSWHSIELNAMHKVKEWSDQTVRFALEEDAFLFPTGWQWVLGRQSEFYLIK